MSQIDRACAKLETYASIFEYVRDNYPSILKEWSNGGINATTAEGTKAVIGQEVIDYDT